MPPVKYDMGYIRSAEYDSIPQLLSVYINSKTYFFQLETYHLNQHINNIKTIPKCHNHKVFHIVQYTEKTPETNMRINDKKIMIKPGSIVMLPPDVPHSFQSTGNDAYYSEITFSMATTDGEYLSTCKFADLFKIWSGIEYQHIDYVFTPSEILRHALQRHFQIVGQKLQNDSSNLFPTISAIAEMLLFLMGHMTGIEPDADSRLVRARNYIENNYLKRLSLKSIAKHAGMSHEHFCKQFKREFGLPPLQYRQQLRINAAIQLLSVSELQVTEIAERLGFSDIYAFSRAFKNHTGTSPARFRHSGTIENK